MADAWTVVPARREDTCAERLGDGFRPSVESPVDSDTRPMRHARSLIGTILMSFVRQLHQRGDELLTLRRRKITDQRTSGGRGRALAEPGVPQVGRMSPKSA